MGRWVVGVRLKLKFFSKSVAHSLAELVSLRVPNLVKPRLYGVTKLRFFNFTKLRFDNLMKVRLDKKNVKKEIFQIYTDGSHKGRWGSWAYVILKGDAVVTEHSGRELKTGSTRMEIQAAIEALQFLPAGSQAQVFSDSRILIEAMTKKIKLWQEQGWVNKSNHAIPNADQLQHLHQLALERNISWQWVKGHSGLKYNERCDFLCTKARLGLQK